MPHPTPEVIDLDLERRKDADRPFDVERAVGLVESCLRGWKDWKRKTPDAANFEGLVINLVICAGLPVAGLIETITRETFRATPEATREMLDLPADAPSEAVRAKWTKETEGRPAGPLN